MTINDQHGYVATGGISVDQCIQLLIGFTTRKNGRDISRVLVEKRKELTAVAKNVGARCG